MTIEQSVLDAIEKKQDQLFEILKALIRFPTENPPGNEAKQTFKGKPYGFFKIDMGQKLIDFTQTLTCD